MTGTYRVLKSWVIGEKDTVDEYGWKELAVDWTPPDGRGYVKAEDLGRQFGEGYYLLVPAVGEFGHVGGYHVVAVTSYEFAKDEELEEVPA